MTRLGRTLAFLGILSLPACKSTPIQDDPAGAGPGGSWTVHVDRANPGEGHSPGWLRDPATGGQVAIGVGMFGWVIDGTWTPPANAATLCPGGYAVVQVILSWKHTWRDGLDPGTLAAARALHPDKENVVDLPTGPGNPTYKGSKSLPGGGQGSADAPGVNQAGTQLLKKLEGEFETCIVCKDGWRPVSCLRWGFSADYTKNPPEITGGIRGRGPGSLRFQDVVQTYLYP
jgi:hypothetical protein